MQDNTDTNKKTKRPVGKIGRAWSLFIFFFSIGFFTFGGGWSIITQMTHEFVEKREWLTKEELMDMVSVSQSLPGIMIINTAVQFGFRLGGVLGSFAAAFGISLPSFIVLAIVTEFYSKLRDNIYVARALTGVRAAVVPIIISAMLRLRKAALAEWLGYALAAVALLICLFTNVNRIFMIIAGAALGIVLASAKLRGAKQNTLDDKGEENDK